MQDSRRFAGVDWASEEHAVCVVDEQGRIVEGRRYAHIRLGRYVRFRRESIDAWLVARERGPAAVRTKSR